MASANLFKKNDTPKLPLLPFAIWALITLVTLSLIRATGAWLYLDIQVLSNQEKLIELWRAFFMGFRFDLSAVCYALALPFLVSIFEKNWITNKKVLKHISLFYASYFSFIFIVYSLISVGDLFYYSYFQDHLNIMIFGFFEDDTFALIKTFWKNYPILKILIAVVLFSAITIYFFFRIFLKLNAVDLASQQPTRHQSKPQTKGLSKFLRIFFSFFFFLTLAVGARGSFGLFPLGVADATISKDAVINYLAFNSLHSLHRAIKLKMRNQTQWNANAKTFGFHSAHSAAEAYFNKKLEPNDDPLSWFYQKMPSQPQKLKPHVLILMMESFGSYWLQFQSSEFNVLGRLAPHFKDDIVYKNFLPSMTATIGSLSSLMIGSPHRPAGGFLTESSSLLVSFRTSPAWYFRKAGYRTRFIYGGAIGWRDIDKFARAQGFDSIEGDFEIEKMLAPKKLEKHDWGLFDGDVWEYVRKTLEQAETPELVVVMTTANHPPYQLPSSTDMPNLKIPQSLEKKLNIEKDLALSRFRAYQYANDQLGQFLSQLKSSSLAEKTVVAATGDHGFLIINFSEEDLLQKWQVPLYLYLPPQLRPLKIDDQIFGSHEDIFATLMPLILRNQTIPILGKDLFNSKIPHEAYHYSNLTISQDGAVIAANPDRFLKWQNQKLQPTETNSNLQQLAIRYKSMMSYLDFYYQYEKQNQSNLIPLKDPKL